MGFVVWCLQSDWFAFWVWFWFGLRVLIACLGLILWILLHVADFGVFCLFV